MQAQKMSPIWYWASAIWSDLVIRVTACNDPTETLPLNEHPVTGPLYSDAACVTWNDYRQIWRRTRETARDVKPLMR